MLLAIILPFFDFTITVGNQIASQLNNFETQEIFNPTSFDQYINTSATVQKTESFNIFGLITGVYIIGSIILFIITLNQLFGIKKLINKHQFVSKGKFKITYTNLKHAPFSCFNYIFLNKESCKGQQFHQIIEHEKRHAEHKHTLDLILHGMISIMHWFNPFIYAYRRSLQEIHEYQADQEVILSGTDKLIYQKNLLNQVELNFSNALISNFNYSLTKRRIKMMNKDYNRRNTVLKTGSVLIVTLIVGLLAVIKFDGASVQAFAIDPEVIPTIEVTDNSPKTFSPIAKKEIKKISSIYGKMKDPFTKKVKMHKGIDIVASKGTSVHAFQAGTVRLAKGHKYRGKYIIIDHEDGYSSLYSHLSKILVKEGQKIEGDEIIGKVGSTGRSTGPHLHFEIKKDDKNIDPATLVKELQK